jgi:RimJ/RimL family protein N-acetyltransferase
MTSIENVSWPLTTERLAIRPAEVSDAAAFYGYRRLDEVSEWLPRLSTDEAAVVERFRDDEFRRRTLVIEVDGRVIGDLYLSISDAWAQAEVQDRTVDAQAEIGWALSPAHQGRGLAFEAVRRLMELCFDELGLHRVFATCFADNVASWRLMEKLGMRREAHTVKDSLHREKGWLDGFTYALLAEEWSAGRQSHGVEAAAL